MKPKDVNSEDFKNLDKRIDKAEKIIKNQKHMSSNVETREYSKGINIIIQLAGTVFIFTLAGYFIDIYFDSLPICLIIFVAIGFFVSIYNVWRETNKNFENIKND